MSLEDVGPEAASRGLDQSGTPYAHYPTPTRFLKADYKFYKTLDDSQEFARRVAQLPPPPPPPPPLSRPRPATAHPAGGQAQRQRQRRQQQPPLSQWREPEVGWLPVYPEPDLSTPPLPSAEELTPDDVATPKPAPELDSSRRLRRPLTAPPNPPPCPGRPSSVAMATAPPPSPPPPPPPPRPQTAAASPLVLVDFSENLAASAVATAAAAATSQAGTQPPLSGGKSASATRFFRPKTAPGRVPSSGGADPCQPGGGLQILGRSLRPQADRASSGCGGVVGPSQVRQLSDAYDRALAVHGWRMEVQGDPFGIKQRFIADRKPVSISVPEPTVKPLPPRMLRTNRFTFFHTTAPRVVMSFDIHPSFTSEQFTKARAALIKQGKWDFRYRDYAFMY